MSGSGGVMTMAGTTLLLLGLGIAVAAQSAAGASAGASAGAGAGAAGAIVLVAGMVAAIVGRGAPRNPPGALYSDSRVSRMNMSFRANVRGEQTVGQMPWIVMAAYLLAVVGVLVRSAVATAQPAVGAPN